MKTKSRRSRVGPDGERFPWGDITKTHSIGEYDIVEAVWDSHGDIEDGTTAFFVYVGQKDTNMSSTTLDGALALAIAHKHGDHGMASNYFMRMIGAGK
jgi:hypothetical protein